MLLVLVNGTDITKHIVRNSIKVTEQLNNRANTCGFQVDSSEVTEGQIVEMYHGFELIEPASVDDIILNVDNTFEYFDKFRNGDKIILNLNSGSEERVEIENIDHANRQITLTNGIQTALARGAKCGQLFFAGVTMESPDERIGRTDTMTYVAQATDFTKLLDQKLVAETYEDMYQREVIARILLTYAIPDEVHTITQFEPVSDQNKVFEFAPTNDMEFFDQISSMGTTSIASTGYPKSGTGVDGQFCFNSGGANAWVEWAGSASGGAMTAATISVWFQISDFASNGVVFDRAFGDTNYPRLYYRSDTDLIQFQYQLDGVTKSLNVNGWLAANPEFEHQWIHCIMTMDAATGVKVFLNGIEVVENTDTGTQFDGSSNKTRIAHEAGLGWYHKGSIDKFVIYDIAFTEEQCLDAYNQHSCVLRPTIHFPLNEGSGTGITDIVSGKTATLHANNGWDTGPNGPVLVGSGDGTIFDNGAVTIDGGVDHVFIYKGDSVAFWVYHDGFSAGGTGGSAYKNSYSGAFVYSGDPHDNEISFKPRALTAQAWDGSGHGIGDTFTAGQWYHIVGSFSNSGSKRYVDGEYVAAGGIFEGNDFIRIDRFLTGYGLVPLYGKMDDIRFYKSRILTAKDAKFLHQNRGKGSQSKFITSTDKVSGNTSTAMVMSDEGAGSFERWFKTTDYSEMNQLNVRFKYLNGAGTKIASITYRIGNHPEAYYEWTGDSRFFDTKFEGSRGYETVNFADATIVGSVDESDFKWFELVVVVNDSVAEGDVLFDLPTGSKNGFTMNNVLRGDKKFEFYPAQYVKTTVLIDEIVKNQYMFWYVDYERNIHVFDQYDYDAPFALTDTSKNFDNLKVGADISQLKNRQTVRGGEAPDEIRYEQIRVADGEEESRFLDYKPKDLKVYVDFQDFLLLHLKGEDLTDSSKYERVYDELEGSVPIVTGKVGNAMDFQNGSNNAIKYNHVNHTDLAVGGSMTIAFWMYSPLQSGRQGILDKAYGGEYSIIYESNGSIALRMGTSGAHSNPHYSFYTPTKIVVGEWTHVAIVRDDAAKTLKMYLNGVIDLDTTYSFDVVTGTNWVLVGKTYAGYFKGKLDDFRIYSTDLSETQIQAIYNAGDGSEDSFVESSVGIENLSDESSTDYVFNFNEKVVRAARAPTLKSGDKIKISYFPYKAIRVRLKSDGSINKMKSLVGGDGIFDGAVINDSSIRTWNEARLRAQAELDAYANAIVTVEFETEIEGLKAGQTVRVTDSTRGLNAEKYLIQSIKRRSKNVDQFMYDVTAQSTMFGIIEFFQLLFKRASRGFAIIQDGQAVETVVNHDEVLNITDVHTYTKFALPYKAAAWTPRIPYNQTAGSDTSGMGNSTVKVAQSFTATSSRVEFASVCKQSMSGSQTGDILVGIQAESGGFPDGVRLQQYVLTNAMYTDAQTGDWFNIPVHIDVTQGEKHFLVLEATNSSGSSYFGLQNNNGTKTYSSETYLGYNGSWFAVGGGTIGASNDELKFKIIDYLYNGYTRAVDQFQLDSTSTGVQIYGGSGVVSLYQTFTAQQNHIHGIALRLMKVGSPVDDLVVGIVHYDGSNPGFEFIASHKIKYNEISSDNFDTSGNWIFAPLNAVLEVGKVYAIQITRPYKSDSTNHYRSARATSTYAGGQYFYWSGSAWFNSASLNLAFKTLYASDLTDGLIRYSDFSDNAFTDLVNGNDGIGNGTIDRVDDHLGYARAIRTGASKYVEIANSAPLQIQGSMTLAAWVNIEDLNGRSCILSKGNTGSDTTGRNVSYWLYYEGDGRWGIFFENSAGSNWLLTTSAGGVSEEGWVHLVGTYNYATGYLDIYKNGKNVGSQDAGVGLQEVNISKIGVGAAIDYLGNVSQYHDGLIAQPMILARAFTDAEVLSLYDLTKSGYIEHTGQSGLLHEAPDGSAQIDGIAGKSEASDVPDDIYS